MNWLKHDEQNEARIAKMTASKLAKKVGQSEHLNLKQVSSEKVLSLQEVEQPDEEKNSSSRPKQVYKFSRDHSAAIVRQRLPNGKFAPKELVSSGILSGVETNMVEQVDLLEEPEQSENEESDSEWAEFASSDESTDEETDSDTDYDPPRKKKPRIHLNATHALALDITNQSYNAGEILSKAFIPGKLLIDKSFLHYREFKSNKFLMFYYRNSSFS